MHPIIAEHLPKFLETLRLGEEPMGLYHTDVKPDACLTPPESENGRALTT